MKRAKTTRRALVMSMLSLLLCVSMLVGTTFAWFTDSVTSGINQIVAGNLDIELEYATKIEDGKFAEWTTVEGKTNLFSSNKWEPGHTEVVYLRLSNLGTLALKYQFAMNFTESEGTNVEGKTFKLSQYLKYGIVDVTEAFASRDAAREAVKANAGVLASHTFNGKMAGKTDTATVTKTIALVIYMPEEVGNEANYKTGTKAPVIDLGLNLFATQVEAEIDSFGPDYDSTAGWLGEVDTDWYNETDSTFVIKTAEELAGVAAMVNGGNSLQGKTIKLGADINLEGTAWTPIGTSAHGFSGTLDGDNYTISNLHVEGAENVGLVGYALNGGNVKNLTIENAYAKGNNYVGAIMGRGYTDIVNCHVKNATIIAVPVEKSEGVYDDGAKAGGIIGQILEGNGNTVTNCSATDVTVYAFRDLGGVVGMVHNKNNCNDNSATNVTLGYILCDKITADENENAGAIYGRVSSSATVSPEKDSTENKKFTLIYAAYGEYAASSIAAFAADTSIAERTVVLLSDVNGDITLTTAATNSVGGDVVIKAAEGVNPVITGNVTLGYREQGVAAAMWNGDVTFEGVTFDQADDSKHSITIGDVKSLNLIGCTIIGNGELGIDSARGNATGVSKIVDCTFENAGMQLLGNFATGLVIDGCTLKESKINVQAGNGVTIQDCSFEATLDTKHVGDSFYMIRSNSTPITVKNCKISIDSKLTEVATSQAKWYLLANRGTTNWTVEGVEVTLTEAAAAQTELKVTACTSTGKINTTNLTVNGVVQ